MSTFTGLLLILLAIDSIVVVAACYKQNWKLFGICVAIGALLDLLLVKYGSFGPTAGV